MRFLVLQLLACALVHGHMRPNLLFMMADQLRFDAVGPNLLSRSRRSFTPNIDKHIAGQGVTFKKHYTSTPTCTPARAALLTGLSPWNHGMLGYGQIAPRYAFEMPRALARGGYVTASLGKDHFGWANGTGVAHGFSETDLYDGIVSERDDYHQWFTRSSGKGPDVPPESGWPTLDMNSWRGAPYVYNESLHPTAWVGAAAVRWLHNYSESQAQSGASETETDEVQPFFLKVSFHRPHSPYDPPSRLLASTTEADLPPVVTCDKTNPPGAAAAATAWDSRFDSTDAATAAPGCGPSNADAWCGHMPDDDVLLARRAYRASVAFVDEQVGAVFDALRDTGLLDNTLVLFTADHGDGQGDHYHWRKGYPYEFSSHVPLVVRWPTSMNDNFTAARGSVVSSGVTELRDVFPTFLDAAQYHVAAAGGKEPPWQNRVDGRSLLCLLRDPTGQACPNGPYDLQLISGKSEQTGKAGGPASTAPGGRWRSFIGLEHNTCYNGTNHWSALTDGVHKYIYKAWNASEQLFDLGRDPWEKEDLAEDAAHHATLLLWRQRLVQQFEEENRGPGWVVNSSLVRRVVSQNYSPNYPGTPPDADDGLMSVI